MLLMTHVRAAADRASAGRESGSALASVLGVLAVSVVVAATLLAMSMVSAGTSSAGRASVQAIAAAEGGIDAAKAAMPACTSGTFVNAPGTTPQYTVAVSHRATTGTGS